MSEEKTMRVFGIEIENFRRVKLVKLDLRGQTMTALHGANGHGKSSVLDAFVACIAGAFGAGPDQVREGERAAFVRIELGEPGAETFEIAIEKTFMDGKQVLQVKRADGTKVRDMGQTELNQFWNKITLRPGDFMRMAPEEQAKLVQGILGLDFTEHDKARKALYEQRTAVGRDLERATGAYNACAADAASFPTEMVYAADLIGKIEADTAARADRTAWSETLHRLSTDVAAAREALRKAEAAVTAHTEAEPQAIIAPDDAIAEIRARLANAESHNQKVRDRADWATKKVAMEALTAEYDEYTARITAMDEAKRTALAGAAWPMPGMSFSEDGKKILYDGRDMAAASDAQALMNACAIGLALKPRCPFVLVKQAAMMDPNTLVAFERMLEERGAHALIELPGASDGGLTIYDGSLLGVNGGTEDRG